MSHVDDGRIEAWLDRDRSGMTGDEVVAIAQHLETCAACSNRLQQASAARDRTASILEGSMVADGVVPDFEKIRARARGGSARPITRRPGIRPLVGLAWAASVVAAIGVGWLTRDLLAPRPLAYEGPGASSAPIVADAGVSGGGAVGMGRSAESPRLEAMSASPPATSLEAVRPVAATTAATAADPGQRAAAGPGGEQPASPDLAGVVSEQAVITAVAAADIAPTTNGASASPGALVARGRVVAAGGVPIPGALVRLGTGASTITDSEGRYSLSLSEEQVARGSETTLTAEVLGYGRGSVAIDHPDRDTIAADFELYPLALALDEIVALGYSRAPTPAANAALPSTVPVSPETGARLTGSQGSEVGPAPAVRRIGAAADLQTAEPALPREAVTAEEAARRLGAPLVSLPDLETLTIEWVTVTEGGAVHLRHRLVDGGTVLLVQSPGSAPVTGPVLPGMTVVNVHRGNIHISAQAEMPRETLQALLQGLR